MSHVTHMNGSIQMGHVTRTSSATIIIFFECAPNFVVNNLCIWHDFGVNCLCILHDFVVNYVYFACQYSVYFADSSVNDLWVLHVTGKIVHAYMRVCVCLCVCMCVVMGVCVRCVRARVRARTCTRLCACVYGCVCMCVRVCGSLKRQDSFAKEIRFAGLF